MCGPSSRHENTAANHRSCGHPLENSGTQIFLLQITLPFHRVHAARKEADRLEPEPV